MDILIATCSTVAILLLALGLHPPARSSTGPGMLQRLQARNAAQIQAARLHIDARRFTLASWAAPPLFAAVGWVTGSPLVAVGAAVGALFVPRAHLRLLVRRQQTRSENEAPRLLQVLVASLAAGRTYLDALEEARTRVHDRWIREDLDHIIRQFYLDIPLEASITEIRARADGRNLALIWDNLAICIGNRIPTSRAQELFVELSASVQFNVQVQQEVRAKTGGQRAQIWMLAAIVPGLFLYLRIINPDFFTVLDQTAAGRFVLFPAAVALEIGGILLSVRASRVEV